MSEVLKIQEVKLDLKRVTAQPQSIQPLTVMDNGNVFVISLTDNGLPVDLTDCNVLAVFSTADGKTAQQDSNTGLAFEKNIITIRVRTGSFSYGQNKCELQIYSGDTYETIVTSARFTFDGVRGIVNDDTVTADENFPVLVSLIKQVEEASSKSEEAVASAEDAVRRADEAVEKAEGVVETLGDMTKREYDTNNNGVVDDAERLGGQLPSYYASAASVSEAVASVSINSLGAEPKRLQFENVTVASSAFAADTTIPDYGYRAAVALPNVTAGMIPDVIFSQASVSLGVFSCNAASFNGGIYIYASEIPEATTVIPTIIVWR